MRRLLLPLFLLLLASVPASALAQDGDGGGGSDAPPADAPQEAPNNQQPEPEPQPDPEAGRATLGTSSGLKVDGRRYAMRGKQLFLRGVVTPVVEGQQMTVEVTRDGRVIERIRAPISGAGDSGRFSARFEPGRSGSYSFQAVHQATDEQEAFRSRAVRLAVVNPSAGQGARGTRVKLLHKGLAQLGFVAPSGSRFSDATARAVIAFRKTNGMSRRGHADRNVYSKLLRGEGGFRTRHDHKGRYVEFDISRQVLVLARNGKAQRIYHASSGKSSTPTVRGSFRFYRKDRGTNSVGMVHSSYFHFGYAIHGYKSVPTYPASHGCIRVPIPDALSIYNWIGNGDRIHVYR